MSAKKHTTISRRISVPRAFRNVHGPVVYAGKRAAERTPRASTAARVNSLVDLRRLRRREHLCDYHISTTFPRKRAKLARIGENNCNRADMQ